MASIFKREHDAEGRERLEIGMNTRLFQCLAIAVPAVFLAVTWYVLADAPQGVPWFFIVLTILFAAAALAMVTWMGHRSGVSVTLDGNTGRLRVRTGDGERELRMADITRAEFATTSSEGSMLCRLELVLKSGERVPATSGYSNLYAAGHQKAMVKVINAALGRQML